MYTYTVFAIYDAPIVGVAIVGKLPVLYLITRHVYQHQRFLKGLLLHGLLHHHRHTQSLLCNKQR